MKYRTETLLILSAAVTIIALLVVRDRRDELRPFTYDDIPTKKRGEIDAAKLGLH